MERESFQYCSYEFPYPTPVWLLPLTSVHVYFADDFVCSRPDSCLSKGQGFNVIDSASHNLEDRELFFDPLWDQDDDILIQCRMPNRQFLATFDGGKPPNLILEDYFSIDSLMVNRAFNSC